MTQVIKHDQEAHIELISPSETHDSRYKGGLYEIKLKKNIQKLIRSLTLEIIYQDQTRIIKNEYYDYSETIDSFSFHFTHFFEPNEKSVNLHVTSYFDPNILCENKIEIENI